MKKRPLKLPLIALSACACAVLITNPVHAAPRVPKNLGAGLDELVSSNLEMQNAKAAGKKKEAAFTASDGKTYTTARAAEAASNAVRDAEGRISVRAHLDGLHKLDEVTAAISARAPSFTVTAVDKFKGGVIEGYVSLDEVPAIAVTSGVRSLHMTFPLELNKVAARETPKADVVPGQTITQLGTTTDQGVFQHRVDQINKYYNPSAPVDYEGTNISIGFMSDSYNKVATVTTASTDVANFDLPGSASNPVNTQPVVVLQDLASGGTDEGRGMGQIVYKMAPKARIAFATAGGGEANFARNIRALAGLPGATYPAGTQQGFAADVICDDISYGSMPFFEDGIVGSAVDDVAAAGVMYFSSAGNDIGSYDYESDYRNVPVGSAIVGGVLAGTNINLANVPTALYQGGFHNYRTDGGVDLAQTVNVVTVANGLPATNFQWDDPFNQTIPVIQPAIYHNEGEFTASVKSQNFSAPGLVGGTKYVLSGTAQPGSDADVILTIKDPNGTVLIDHFDVNVDDAQTFTATVSGTYTITVDAFGTGNGKYNIDIFLAAPTAQVTSDFNILVFRADNGAYLPNSSLVTDNIASNTPQEFRTTPPPTGQTQVQYVICRRTVPVDPTPASHFRWIIRGNGLAGVGPAEYITINTPNTGLGHRLAKGCFSTAAYSVFRPSIPEYFTSPGPALVFFDKTGTRLAAPEVRLKPDIAAADNGNTSMFGGDGTSDLDTKPNFSGTSAASPHAAAISALVLQAHGGRGSMTPAQMKTLLQGNAFLHDLDPYSATGVARTSQGGKVTVRIDSDRGLNPSSGAFNPNSISLSYIGAGNVTSFVFNPEGTAATGGAPNAGNNGLDASNVYFSNIYPGVVFQALPAGGRTSGTFVLGDQTVGLTAADVVPAFLNPAGLPSTGTSFWTLSLNFPTGAFTGGKVLRFTTGHAQQHDSTVTLGLGPTGGVTGVNTTQADLFGGGVQIPEGTVVNAGMTFNGTTSGGGTFSGTIQNRIGKGFSVLDGFGFINAEAAVAAPVQ